MKYSHTFSYIKKKKKKMKSSNVNVMVDQTVRVVTLLSHVLLLNPQRLHKMGPKLTSGVTAKATNMHSHTVCM